MNEQIIIGNLGQDCSVGTTSGRNGTSYVSFSVAATSGYGDNKRTEWVDCVKWGEKTGVAEYLQKGALVYVRGDAYSEDYKGKTQRKLRVKDLKLLGSREN